MHYFSQLQERRVMDRSGRPVGKVHDIGVNPESGFPQTESLVIARSRRGRRETVAVPWGWVSRIESSGVFLDRDREEVWDNGIPSPGLLLGRNLLDRQIVDLNGNKVVRVNDLCLAEFDSSLRLIGVDVSQRALLRRLGMEKPVAKALSVAGIDLPAKTIPWNFVAPLEVRQPDLQLTVSQAHLDNIHPTDLADIIEQLDPTLRGRLLDLLDAFTAAQSLSEVEPEKQAEVIEGLTETRASSLLEIMPPDEAADILSHLPRDKAERLLNIMGVEEAGVLRELLGYREDTAGGRMTPEYLAVPGSFTAQQCIEYLRQNAPDAETLYYVYVLDDEGRLKGVVSLRDLLTSPPQSRVEDIMNPDVVSVNVDDDQEAVAEVIKRYNFLALPVVDDANLLKGIITVDDMIDVLRQEAIEDLSHLGGLELTESGGTPTLKARLPAVSITLLGGCAAAAILLAFQESAIPLVTLAFFMPLLLRAAQDMGMVSQAVVLESIGGRELAAKEVLYLAWREMRVVFLISLGLASLAGVAALLWQGQGRLAAAVGISLFISVLSGSLVGTTLPLLARRLRGELGFTQARFSSLFIALLSLSLYLGISTAMLGRG